MCPMWPVSNIFPNGMFIEEEKSQIEPKLKWQYIAIKAYASENCGKYTINQFLHDFPHSWDSGLTYISNYPWICCDLRCRISQESTNFTKQRSCQWQFFQVWNIMILSPLKRDSPWSVGDSFCPQVVKWANGRKWSTKLPNVETAATGHGPLNYRPCWKYREHQWFNAALEQIGDTNKLWGRNFIRNRKNAAFCC